MTKLLSADEWIMTEPGKAFLAMFAPEMQSAVTATASGFNEYQAYVAAWQAENAVVLAVRRAAQAAAAAYRRGDA